ncbi:MAG: hydrogenase expression/formation protein HypE [Candidatus Nitronauta litoralis]|uniref:Hydrogenase expression/formation protein HypE n=1 Tax=Candidatus Nitronauta litoralis TaxID=2705533 RepID=A0A7T0FZI0_9BACT|nr:MAG: hydrogenase expression/formation protein HypE [Candidatus Nitronauta litoralis]
MKPPPQNSDSTPGESCPAPLASDDKILLAHGGGGRLMHQLIESIFRPAFQNPELETHHDGAVLDFPSDKLVMTTDSYVVQPLIFPGGDIGSLAVNGTVNDLAMCGARPLYLSVGFILEEGLPVSTLRTIANSMKISAQESGVHIVTGDTKVVAKGNGDGIFLNTTGVGAAHPFLRSHPDQIQPGDAILISGDIARHGIAVLAARENLEFDPPLQSDCASLSSLVQKLIKAKIQIRCLRDLTRGGLATGLIEMAGSSKLKFTIDENRIVVHEPVQGACELLGFDPLYIANEGCFVVVVAPDDAKRAVEILRKEQNSSVPDIIGKVEKATSPHVVLKTSVGSTRVLDMLSGDQLPRIC